MKKRTSTKCKCHIKKFDRQKKQTRPLSFQFRVYIYIYTETKKHTAITTEKLATILAIHIFYSTHCNASYFGVSLQCFNDGQIKRNKYKTLYEKEVIKNWFDCEEFFSENRDIMHDGIT